MSTASHRATSTEELNEMWRSQAVYWHVIFGVLLAITAAIVLAERHRTWGWQLALLAVLGLAYFRWGPRALYPGGGAARIYVSIGWAVFFGLILLDPQGQPWPLTFALFPQTWAMLGRLAAVITTLGIVVFTGIRIVQDRTVGDELVATLIGSLVMLAMSLALGLFITRIVREADSRAQALDELRRAQERLTAAERSAATFAERERLSREIHDTLAQGFTSVVTLARAADAALDRDDVRTARDRLALLEQTASENLAEARLMVTELTPGHLQSGTLREALERLVARVAREAGLDGALHVRGTQAAVGANAEVVVLRTAQEALANVRRHSGADGFSVVLSYDDPSRLILEVADDGCGFDPDDPGADAGYGLAGVRARAADLGADLAIESAPGAGTTLRVSVPR